MKKINQQKGFILLELIVSLSIFTIVMLVAVGAMLSVVDGNRKARSQQTVIDNLQFALDTMVRNIRVGTNYHCGDEGTKPYDEWRNCSGGQGVIAVEGPRGVSTDPNDQIVYMIDISEQEILVSTDSGLNWSTLTSPDVVVENLKFYVFGSDPTDIIQPKVLIALRGYVQINNRTRSDFNIQTLVSQRIPD